MNLLTRRKRRTLKRRKELNFIVATIYYLNWKNEYPDLAAYRKHLREYYPDEHSASPEGMA